MSVPLTLLGLLDREPSHGYDLKRDYDTYFGRDKPLPFGQVYATLARLARDGKAVGRGGRARSRSRSQALHHHRDRQERGRGVAGRAHPGRAPPPDGPVREGRALAHARSPGGGVPRRAAGRTPRSGCASSPSSSRRGNLVDALLADHGLFHLEADLALDRPHRPLGWRRSQRRWWRESCQRGPPQSRSKA